MAWQQNNLLKKYDYIFGLFFTVLVSAQEPVPKKEYHRTKRITFGVRALAFVTYSEDSLLEPDNPFDFNNDTRLIGMNLSVNYNIINGISIGVGSGFETFTQPKFTYVPLYTRLALNGGTVKDSFHVELIIGGHFTNDSRRGGLHRFLLGYRFRVHKTLFADVSMLYTYQNLYQTFDGSQRLDNYYNFDSIGLSIGLDLN